MSHRARSIVLAAFLVLATACTSTPIELTLRAPQDTELEVALSMTQVVVEERPGGKVESHQTVTFRWTQRVEEVRADGTRLLAIRYESARLFAESPDFGVVEYDSADDNVELSPLALGLDAAIGETLRLEVGPGGEILGTPGLDVFLDRVADRLRLSDPADRAAARQALNARFGPGAVRELFAPFYSLYPGGPVAEGDSWRRRAEVRTPFPHVQDNEYELVDVDAERATLRLRSRLLPLADAKPRRMGTAEVSYAIEGEQRGKIRLDRATGLPMLGELVQELEGTVTYAIPGAEPFELPVRVEAEIRFAAVR